MTEAFHMTRSVRNQLAQVSHWHYDNHPCEVEGSTIWCDFVGLGPDFFFEHCPGFPEKASDPEFRRSWNTACSILRDHGALEEESWRGVSRFFLHVKRLREILALAVIDPEEPAEAPAKGAGLYGDLAPPATDTFVLKIPTASTVYTFDGADLHIDAGEGPEALRKATEEKIGKLRARLQDVFNHSIAGGPMPHLAAICIIEAMLGEYGESDEFAVKAGDFFAEAQKIGKNPIRYAAWLACSELLSRARAVVKGLTPETDGCMVEEYESALRDLGVGVKP